MGRGHNSGLTAAPQPAPQPQPVPQPQPAPQPVQAPQPAPPVQQGNVDAQGYRDYDAADFHDLYNGRNYYQQQLPHWSAATQQAVNDYLDPTVVAGSLYAKSQTINHKMRTGQNLTAAEKAMQKGLDAAMHNIGYNVNLVRYDRVDFIQNLGLANYQNMSIAQIQKALVGKTYVDPAYVSTSYNQFKNAPSNNPFTDKAVKINMKAPAKTQAFMPGNGAGGNLGEIVLAPGQSYKITGVRFTGKRGRSGASYYPQIEIDVEIQ